MLIKRKQIGFLVPSGKKNPIVLRNGGFHTQQKFVPHREYGFHILISILNFLMREVMNKLL